MHKIFLLLFIELANAFFLVLKSKSMIKFDFTTFIPISKLIYNEACQVFI